MVPHCCRWTNQRAAGPSLMDVDKSATAVAAATPRFEVKKVPFNGPKMVTKPGGLVERGGYLVVGYSSGQLCHLPKPHYGHVH